jgi:hypothetical protein
MSLAQTGRLLGRAWQQAAAGGGAQAAAVQQQRAAAAGALRAQLGAQARGFGGVLRSECRPSRGEGARRGMAPAAASPLTPLRRAALHNAPVHPPTRAAHAGGGESVTYAGLTLKKAPFWEYAASKAIGGFMWWAVGARHSFGARPALRPGG